MRGSPVAATCPLRLSPALTRGLLICLASPHAAARTRSSPSTSLTAHRFRPEQLPAGARDAGEHRSRRLDPGKPAADLEQRLEPGLAPFQLLHEPRVREGDPGLPADALDEPELVGREFALRLPPRDEQPADGLPLNGHRAEQIGLDERNRSNASRSTRGSAPTSFSHTGAWLCQASSRIRWPFKGIAWVKKSLRGDWGRASRRSGAGVLRPDRRGTRPPCRRSAPIPTCRATRRIVSVRSITAVTCSLTASNVSLCREPRAKLLVQPRIPDRRRGLVAEGSSQPHLLLVEPRCPLPRVSTPITVPLAISGTASPLRMSERLSRSRMCAAVDQPRIGQHDPATPTGWPQRHGEPAQTGAVPEGDFARVTVRRPVPATARTLRSPESASATGRWRPRPREARARCPRFAARLPVGPATRSSGVPPRPGFPPRRGRPAPAPADRRARGRPTSRSTAIARTLATACAKWMSSWLNVRRLVVCTPSTPYGRSRPGMIDAHPAHDALLAQERRSAEPGIGGQVVDEHRFGDQQRVARRGVRTRPHRCPAHVPRLPSHAGAQQ